MRLAFATLCAVISLSACRSSSSESTGLTFGDGDAILKTVIDSVQSVYDTEFSSVSWSGGRSNDEFAVEKKVVVKNADVSSVSVKLYSELQKLPARRGWISHGSGIGGFYLDISYEEDGAQFYFDFVLRQRQEDVEVLILHKGVRR